ncbi:MAG: ABC transporter ATP-binding protein [Candidatus Heimdallarchaeaceae archaeon]
MSTEFIRVENLCKTYISPAERLEVLRGCSFTIFSGDVVCLLGVSGSGKTTLLNLISGLDSPTSGEIYYDGVPLHSLTLDQIYDFRLKNIGFIFQDFHLLEHFTALENVMSPLLLQGHSESFSRSVSFDLLSRVGLSDKVDSYPDQLSSGQKQRVAIARSLAKVPLPRLLIADEPTGTLDSRTGDSIMELILGLSSEHNLTTIFTTHELFVAKLASRIFLLRNGKITSLSPSDLNNESFISSLV